MKAWLLPLALLLAIAAITFLGAMFITSRPAYAATQIFKALRRGDLPAIRSRLSAELAPLVSEGSLRAFVARSAHAAYADARWSPAVIEGERATLAANLESRLGEITPLLLTLKKESGQWKLLAADASGPEEAAAKAPGLRFPPTGELVPLARNSLRDFAEAAQTGDFQAFRSKTARLWQEESSAAQLAEAYRPLWLAYPRVEELGDTAIAFSREPEVNDSGFLLLAGHATELAPALAFECAYLWEDGAWRLVSLRFSSS